MKNNLEELEDKILHLMIESYHPEDNAYNHGLAHAMLVVNGGDVESIKKTRDERRRQVLQNDLQ